MNATLVLTDVHLCVADCVDATSHVEECECRCGGANHGMSHRAGIQAAKDAVKVRQAREGLFLGAEANYENEEIW